MSAILGIIDQFGKACYDAGCQDTNQARVAMPFVANIDTKGLRDAVRAGAEAAEDRLQIIAQLTPEDLARVRGCIEQVAAKAGGQRAARFDALLAQWDLCFPLAKPT